MLVGYNLTSKEAAIKTKYLRWLHALIMPAERRDLPADEYGGNQSRRRARSEGSSCRGIMRVTKWAWMKPTAIYYVVLLASFGLGIFGVLHFGSKLPSPSGAAEAVNFTKDASVEPAATPADSPWSGLQ